MMSTQRGHNVWVPNRVAGVFSPQPPHYHGMRVRTARFTRVEHTMTSGITVGHAATAHARISSLG